MSTLALKIVGGSVALGSLGIATYFGGRELLRSPTIKEQLVKEKFKFIPSSSANQWKAEFESDKEAIKKALGETITDGPTLKAWCESKFGASSTDEKDLNNVKTWCGIRDIKSQLARNKRTLLVGAAGNDVEGKWTATIGHRKTNNKGADKLNLGESWTTSDITEKVKTWCNNNSKSYFLEEQDTYKLVEAWCTEQGKDVTLQ